MKQLIKISIILIIMLLLIMILNNNVYASGTIDTNITIGGTSAIYANKTMTETMLGIMQVIGSVISVVALLIIGFRYMLSSVEEKASMKGVMIYYVVGAVLVFATSNLLGVAYDIIRNLKV